VSKKKINHLSSLRYAKAGEKHEKKLSKIVYENTKINVNLRKSV